MVVRLILYMTFCVAMIGFIVLRGFIVDLKGLLVVIGFIVLSSFLVVRDLFVTNVFDVFVGFTVVLKTFLVVGFTVVLTIFLVVFGFLVVLIVVVFICLQKPQVSGQLFLIENL